MNGSHRITLNSLHRSGGDNQIQYAYIYAKMFSIYVCKQNCRIFAGQYELRFHCADRIYSTFDGSAIGFRFVLDVTANKQYIVTAGELDFGVFGMEMKVQATQNTQCDVVTLVLLVFLFLCLFRVAAIWWHWNQHRFNMGGQRKFDFPYFTRQNI